MRSWLLSSWLGICVAWHCHGIGIGMNILWLALLPVFALLNNNWLNYVPVFERIKFKIMLRNFKALHQQSTVYIQDFVTYYQPSRILRSSHLLLLNPINFHLKSYGSQAFAVSAPELLNSLPDFIHSCDNLSSFKSKLKTHIFKKTYYS